MIQSQFHPHPILTTYFYKLHLNVILPSIFLSAVDFLNKIPHNILHAFVSSPKAQPPVVS
jgi:hypothetical protein